MERKENKGNHTLGRRATLFTPKVGPVEVQISLFLSKFPIFQDFSPIKIRVSNQECSRKSHIELELRKCYPSEICDESARR